jgi:predicted CoA-binding protein
MSKTLVFGASTNPNRYAYRAIKRLRSAGIETCAIGGRSGQVGDVEIFTGYPALEDVHTITLYMGAVRLLEHEDYLLSLKPKRIIFNPGAENRPFAYKARSQGVETLEACTLVMLSTDQY